MAEHETKEGGGSNEASNTEANPKVVVGVLTVIGVVAVVLGFFQILNSIRSPFSAVTDLSNSTVAISEEDERLKGQDTDGDGLNDYDELTLYSTSPFLADSDSDGINDRAEVESGSDPNCPEGTDCGLAFGDTTTDGNRNVSAADTSGFLSGDITIQELRQTLIESGAPAYVVNGISDQELLRLYTDAVQSGGASQATVSDTELVDALTQLTPTEIRQFLIDGGVDATVLAGVDDGEITDFFQRAVAQELNPEAR